MLITDSKKAMHFQISRNKVMVGFLMALALPSCDSLAKEQTEIEFESILVVDLVDIPIPSEATDIQTSKAAFLGARQFIKFVAPQDVARAFCNEVVQGEISVGSTPTHMLQGINNARGQPVPFWFSEIPAEAEGGTARFGLDGQVQVVMKTEGEVSTVWVLAVRP